MGVIVRVRRGAITDGSGQSSDSSIGWLPDRAQRRYTVRRLTASENSPVGSVNSWLVLAPFPVELDVLEARPADLPVQRPGDGQRASRTASPSRRRRLVRQSSRLSASRPLGTLIADRVS